VETSFDLPSSKVAAADFYYTSREENSGYKGVGKGLRRAEGPPSEVWEGAYSPGAWDPRRAILPFPIPVCTAKQRFAGIAAVNTDLSVSSVLHAVKQLAFLAYLRSFTEAGM